MNDTDATECCFCGTWIRYDLGSWVDRTLGDCCPGDSNGDNENGEHTPWG